MQHLYETRNQSPLIWFFRLIIFVLFFILFTRIADLQIVRGKYFQDLSKNNRIRSVPVIAKRGDIIARGGERLVISNEVKKKVKLNPEKGFEKERTEDKEGADIVTEWEREYIGGDKFGHITGYIGEVNEKEVGKVEAECTQKGAAGLGENIGRSGLEAEYDCDLRGIDGALLVEIDSAGRMVRVLGRKNSIPGSDLRTNIDYELQEVVNELLRDKKGAAVVTDMEGRVLSLTSSPSYDPNIFVKKDEDLKVTQVLNDKSLPLLNRSISGTFHPGSVYKPLVALAALEEGKISEDFKYNDTGKITINSIYGNYSFSNWYYLQYGGTEGEINVVRALARSTDTFFYDVGELTGIDSIASWSRKFELDKKTGIDLPGEAVGLVPDPAWKERVIGEKWFLGNTYNVSIGQGDLAVTPLEIQRVTMAIANGGKLCRPHIVDSKDGNCIDLSLKKENLDVVKKGMKEACSTGGTAYTFFDFEQKYGIKVACKTGTAQNVNKEPHAWFTVFAPIENPEIVATILVEEGGEGSKVAGPIARQIFDYWFRDKKVVNE